ncbi:MAG: DUF1629 domain-containing protein [Pseudomonadota bacterium]
MAGTLSDIGKPEPYPNYFYTEIDGEVRKSVLIDDTPDPDDPRGVRISPTKYKNGRWLKPDNIPTRLRLEATDMPVFDFEILYSGPLISEKMKAVIEGLELGIHQFWPMQIEPESQPGRVVATKYFLVVGQRIDSVHRGLTVPEIEPPLSYLDLGRAGSRLVLDLTRIAGRHLWVDSYVCNELLLSGRLIAALEEADCTGWQIQQMIEEIIA